jgi:hypothetical protein
MSREYAEKHYPGATRIERSREVVWCPEGPEEFVHFNWVNTGTPVGGTEALAPNAMRGGSSGTAMEASWPNAALALRI